MTILLTVWMNFGPDVVNVIISEHSLLVCVPGAEHCDYWIACLKTPPVFVPATRLVPLTARLVV